MNNQIPDTAKRFQITWKDDRAGYYVSIPNYGGGEVVTAEAYDALREAATESLRYIQLDPVLDDDGIAVIKRLRAALSLVDHPTTEEGK